MTDAAFDLGNRIVKGTVWLVALRWAARLLGFVSLIILARLLEPRDFGLAALAVMIAGILEHLSDFRTDLALIQNPEAARDHYDTAWTLMLIRGLVLAVLMCLVAQPAAAFLEEPGLEPCVYVLAVAVLIESARNIGTVDFFKELTLDREFKLTIISRLCSFTVVVTLAIILRNYWALIAGVVTYRVMLTILSFRMHPYRPRLHLSRWREIFGFSKWLWLNGVLQYVAYASDVFVLGKLAGASATGLYSVAKRASDLVGSEFVGPVRNALFPGFVQVVKDGPRFRKAFIGSFAIILGIGLPASVGFAVVALPFTEVVLGDKWLAAVPVMQILALNALLIVCIANTQSALFALGRPDLWALVMAVNAVVVVPALILGVNAHGAVGAALGVTIAAFAAFLAAAVCVIRTVGVSPQEIAMATWRSGLAAIAMAATVLFIRDAWPNGPGFIRGAGELVTLVGAGGLVYLSVHLLLWCLSGRPKGPEQRVLSLVLPRLRRTSLAGMVRRLAGA